MSRKLLLVALFSALAFGCSNNDGLQVRGSVVSDTRGEFTFDQDTRLDGPPEGYDSVFTGECEMARVTDEGGEPAWNITTTIRRGTEVDDLGLASVTVSQRTDASLDAGRVEAVFGMTDFASGAEDCSVEIPYAEADAGIVGVTAVCDVYDADGQSETLTVALDMTGCDVID